MAKPRAALPERLQLDDLVTHSVADHEATAIALARHPDRLRAIRDRLTRARTESPLFDGRRIARQLETAYTALIARSQRGLPPDVIEIPA